MPMPKEDPEPELVGRPVQAGIGLFTGVSVEVPDQVPVVVLWQFRMASFGAQPIMWASIGLVFGALAERLLLDRPRTPGSSGRRLIAKVKGRRDGPSPRFAVNMATANRMSGLLRIGAAPS